MRFFVPPRAFSARRSPGTAAAPPSPAPPAAFSGTVLPPSRAAPARARGARGSVVPPSSAPAPAPAPPAGPPRPGEVFIPPDGPPPERSCPAN